MSNTSTTAEGKISDAKMLLLQAMPSIGMILCRMRMTECNEIETTCINKDLEMLWNRAWIDKLQLHEVTCELAHEAGHIWQSAFTRIPEGAIPSILNLAQDQIVDYWFIFKAGLKRSEISQQLLTPKVMAACQKDKTTEVRYANLLKEMKQTTSCGACKDQIEKLLQQALTSQGGEGQGNEGEKGKDEGGSSNDDSGDNGSGGGGGQGDKPHTCNNPRKCITTSTMRPSTPKEQAEATYKALDLTMTAFHAAKNQGKLPGHLVEWMAEIVKPKIKWQDVLKAEISAIMGKVRYNFKLMSRRGLSMGIYLPKREHRTNDFLLVGDTSGSMGQSELTALFSECVGLLKLYGMDSCDMMLHDTDVYYDGKFSTDSIRKGTDKTLKLRQGGTSHLDVFKKIEERKVKPRVVILFSDMYSSFPTLKPKVDCIWCMPKDTPRTHVPGWANKIVYFDIKDYQ